MKTERTRKPAFPSGSGEEGFLPPVAGRRKERGIILFLALLVMALLALLGATFLTMSSTESTIATNEANMARTFNIAEGGLERAKARLKTGTETNNSFLTGTTPGPNLYTGQAFDGGNYDVVISNDTPPDASATADTNNRLFIQSTGTLGTARKRIRALVQRANFAIPNPLGGVEAYFDRGPAKEVVAQKNAVIDGRDWTAPADMSTCPDAATCGTLVDPSAPPVTYGVFSNSTKITASTASGGEIYGTNCTPPSGGACPSTTTTAGIKMADRWDSVANPLIPLAARTLSTNNQTLTGTLTWGTPAAPQVTVVTASHVKIQDVVNGAGVLIVDGGQLELMANAQLNWQGLVIVRGNGAMLGLVADDNHGILRIFGQYATVIDEKVAELEFEDPQVLMKYSSGAMNMVKAAFTPPFVVLSWQEVALQ